MLHFISYTLGITKSSWIFQYILCYTSLANAMKEYISALEFQYILCYTSFLVNTRFLSYKIFTFYHINQHFSTLFTNLFLFFSPQHFIFKNHLIYQSISYISHHTPVGKNRMQSREKQFTKKESLRLEQFFLS